ncbi:MAG: hypothetical protein GEU88_00240 [Solirubrobacterales bacterium]|nr:hypothetical protein [Solirubrobacterales bacterium]
MIAVIAMLAILLGWALVSGRLARWNITPAVAMIAAGALLTLGSDPAVELNLDGRVAERIVEVTLAVVLFVDATEVPAGILGREPRITGRLIGIALPLSLLLAWAAGFLVLPEQGAWILALLATIVVPIDLAPVAAVVRDRRVPGRLRDLLNVEAGLNDGVISPLFFFCLAGAGADLGDRPVGDALLDAVPAALVALGVGAALGFVSARLLGWAWSRGWTRAPGLRLGVLAVPLLSYAVAGVLDGNGFVAAFVAGVLFNSSARLLPDDAVHLVEDAGSLLSLAIWFGFGQVVNEVFTDRIGLDVVVYAILALTVVRVVPVLLSLAGSGIGRRDALFLAWLGPRGQASVVFGLLAFIHLSDPEESFVLEVMTITVLLSVVLHGLSAGPLAAAYGRRPGTDALASAGGSPPVVTARRAAPRRPPGGSP